MSNRSRRLLEVVTPAVSVAILTGTISVHPKAQVAQTTVVGQIEAVSDTVTALTNNINAFGAVLLVVLILVLGLMMFMWRSANAARDARADRLELQKRLDNNNAELILQSREFTKVARGAIYTTNQSNGFIKQFIGQLEADRQTAIANFDKLLLSIGANFKSLEDNQSATLDKFGTSVTGSIDTQLQNIAASQKQVAEYFADKHNETMLQVAEINRKTQLEIAENNRNSREEIAKFTVAALAEMDRLKVAEAKTDTGKLTAPNGTNVDHIDIKTDSVTILETTKGE